MENYLNTDEVDILINEPMGESLLGSKVLLRDLNSDNVADIIIGAPGISKFKVLMREMYI